MIIFSDIVIFLLFSRAIYYVHISINKFSIQPLPKKLKKDIILTPQGILLLRRSLTAKVSLELGGCAEKISVRSKRKSCQ